MGTKVTVGFRLAPLGEVSLTLAGNEIELRGPAWRNKDGQAVSGFCIYTFSPPFFSPILLPLPQSQLHLTTIAAMFIQQLAVTSTHLITFDR